MDWSQLAHITINALGQPCAFYRSGKLICEQDGVYKSHEKHGKHKHGGFFVSDSLTTTFNAAIGAGDTVNIDGQMKLIQSIQQDGSGGMKLILAEPDHGSLDRRIKKQRESFQ